MSMFLQSIDDLIDSLQSFKSFDYRLTSISSALALSIRQGKFVLTAGNGGSASQASHLAAELSGRFELDRRSYPSISLSADPSTLTSISNDFSFSDVFSRQISGYQHDSITCIFFTTSGNSSNILSAAEYCQRNNIEFTIITGNTGGKADLLFPSHTLVVPSTHTPRTQELHLLTIHYICHYIDHALTGP